MRVLAMLLLLPLLLGACAPGARLAASALTDAAARSLILSQPLLDVRSGERFSLGQFRGVTIVLNAAVW